MKTFEEREWNYYFNVGDKVKICDDSPSNYLYNLSKLKPSIKDCINKVGTVTNCYSDMHAFCCGSLWMVKVDFDGVILELMSQFFIKIDE
jgi:hypothetical protein